MNFYGKCMVNVAKYTSPMDPLGENMKVVHGKKQRIRDFGVFSFPALVAK